MKSRVLVTYATRAGSTGEVAEAIGRILRDRGFFADVRTIKSRPRVKEYDVVLIGSAVRTGAWLPEAVSFAAEHQLDLKRIPVAVFTVHLHHTGRDPQSVANRRAYLSTVRPLLNPISEGYFSGAINPASLPLLERLMVKAVKAPTGDFRDWEVIQAWAESLELQPAAARVVAA
jgi:menaquinone-dependent protoporphyrinogen oxidase